MLMWRAGNFYRLNARKKGCRLGQQPFLHGYDLRNCPSSETIASISLTETERCF